MSAREKEVLCLIAKGRRINEIAVELCLEAGTVESYRRRLVQKLGISSNAELTHCAIRQGWVSL